MSENDAPEGANVVTLTVCGDRIVNGCTSGQMFDLDLGDEGSDERAVNERQVRAWVMGGHVVDPVLATRRKKRKPAKPKGDD